MQSDRELMERIVNRDAGAFEVLFERYRGEVYRYLSRTIRDNNAADDFTQEVFLRVWTRAEQWSGQGVFKAWLFRIATNLALNHLRSVRRKREQPLEIQAEDNENFVPSWMVDASSLGPDAVLELSEQRMLLRSVIAKLPEEKREVMRMVYESEMDTREISEVLGIPEGTVKSRLHYATKHLISDFKNK